jgi:hypothetical protein
MAAAGIINQQVGPQPDPNSPMAPPVANAATPAVPTGIINSAVGAPTVPTVPTAPAPAPAAAPTQPAAATDYTKQINDFYQKDFGRDADQAGMAYWKSGMANNNLSLDQVDGFMRNSDEYKALHGAPATVTPNGATPGQLGTPTQWNVTPNQTVQGQMAGMIDRNNPFYQQWATAGAQEAAARGFTGNSSIRDTGIMDSVMRNATPIATADASTYAKAAGYNADMPNQFAMKNADMSQQSALANLSADTQKFVAGLSAQTQRDVANMNNQSQAAISQAHDANSALIASNSNAKEAYNNYVAAVAQIDQNDKMDAAAKESAIIHQNQLFNSAMAGIKAASPGASDLYNPNDPISISAKAQADAAAKANADALSNPQAAAVAAVGGVDVSDQLQQFGG